MSLQLYKNISATKVELKSMPFLSELFMESFLIENQYILGPPDVSKVEIITNQLHVKDGRGGNKDGRIDLLVELQYPTETKIAIVELKNGKLNMKHLKQLEEYIKAFNIDDYASDFSQPVEHQDYELLGILVGTDADEEVKELLIKGYKEVKELPIKDYKDDEVEIIGMSINRLSTLDGTEIYTYADTFVPETSSSSRVRYSTWIEFLGVQKERKLNETVTDIAEEIFEYVSKELNVDLSMMSLAPKVFSCYATTKSGAKRVFLYVEMQEKQLKIYMKSDGCPEPGVKKRRDDNYLVVLNENLGLTDRIKTLIIESHEFIKSS